MTLALNIHSSMRRQSPRVVAYESLFLAIAQKTGSYRYAKAQNENNAAKHLHRGLAGEHSSKVPCLKRLASFCATGGRHE
jgi:hypothetical protein